MILPTAGPPRTCCPISEHRSDWSPWTRTVAPQPHSRANHVIRFDDHRRCGGRSPASVSQLQRRCSVRPPVGAPCSELPHRCARQRVWICESQRVTHSHADMLLVELGRRQGESRARERSSILLRAPPPRASTQRAASVEVPRSLSRESAGRSHCLLRLCILLRVHVSERSSLRLDERSRAGPGSAL